MTRQTTEELSGIIGTRPGVPCAGGRASDDLPAPEAT